jgi:hypothetical protein
MKHITPYKILTNTISIFEEKKYLLVFSVALIFFFGLFAFFYGLYTIPMPKGVLGFYRMESPTSFEMVYIVFSTIMSALIATITIFTTRMKLEGSINGKRASALGVATSIAGAVCPACLGINFLAFGNVFTNQLPFLVPYLFWIQISGMTLLLVGLYIVAKNAYDKKCIMCAADPSFGKSEKKTTTNNELSIAFLVAAVFVVGIFIYQLSTIFAGMGAQATGTVAEGVITTEQGEEININDIIEVVTPKAGFTTQVRWGDVVAKMVQDGVLDPQKLESIITNTYGQEMKPEWKAVLAGEDANLTIDGDNAVFMMYVLWVLAKHNNNEILLSSPIASYFENYDIGVGRAGYGDTALLTLTPEQQAIAKKVAENAYRPCCGNSTAAPDCSHGFSALGLIELMASQGFSEKEIFEVFIQFNSFWFPETYIKNALYVKATEGLDWKDVSKELVAGAEYSTLQGSYKAKNYLKEKFGI